MQDLKKKIIESKKNFFAHNKIYKSLKLSQKSTFTLESYLAVFPLCWLLQEDKKLGEAKGPLRTLGTS